MLEIIIGGVVIWLLANMIAFAEVYLRMPIRGEKRPVKEFMIAFNKHILYYGILLTALLLFVEWAVEVP